MAAFPLTHNSFSWDSKRYKVEYEDQAIRTKMEGGYMTSRPRHTRAPRATITLGWTDMTKADWDTLVAFYQARKGGSETFTWTDPMGTTRTVRFKQALSGSYHGMSSPALTVGQTGMAGVRQMWDVTVVFEEV